MVSTAIQNEVKGIVKDIAKYLCEEQIMTIVTAGETEGNSTRELIFSKCRGPERIDIASILQEVDSGKVKYQLFVSSRDVPEFEQIVLKPLEVILRAYREEVFTNGLIRPIREVSYQLAQYYL